jgi:hypothetical protein
MSVCIDSVEEVGSRSKWPKIVSKPAVYQAGFGCGIKVRNRLALANCDPIW